MEVGNGSRAVSAGKQIAASVLTRILLGKSAGIMNGKTAPSLSEKICDLDIPDKIYLHSVTVPTSGSY